MTTNNRKTLFERAREVKLPSLPISLDYTAKSHPVVEFFNHLSLPLLAIAVVLVYVLLISLVIKEVVQ